MTELTEWTEADWWWEGIRQRWIAVIKEVCPRRQRIKRAVGEDRWENVMKEIRRLPDKVGRELCRRFFTPLPHGKEVGNFIAQLLYDIPWLRPQGDPKKLKAKLRSLAHEFQIRLQPFGLKTPLPVRIIGKDEAVEEITAEGAAGVAAWVVEAAGVAAEEAAKEAAGVVAWVAWAAAGAAVKDVGLPVAENAAKAVNWLIGQDQPWLEGKKSPFESLIAVWFLGAWPMGFFKTPQGQPEFLIFLP